MKTVYLLINLLVSTFSFGQTVETKLANAMKGLEKDGQFKHAILSLYVVDSKSGKVVYDKNSQAGLAPASCQKVITSASVFELLGGAYKYKTEMAYSGAINDSVLNGDLYFIPSGDPTMGSWRWEATDAEKIKQKILAALKAQHIAVINGDMIVDETKWETQSTPKGWVWEDVGNYYGAGARGMNWHENQYDLILKPGKNAGEPVEIIITKPELLVTLLVNELKTGAQGSGDQSVIYLPEEGLIGFLRGTIPAGKETFTVSGSMPNAAYSFTKTIEDCLDANHIKLKGKAGLSSFMFLNKEKRFYQPISLFTYYSPPMDSINYWFLKKSVNLYGEAFVKTMAYEKTKFGSTDSGLDIIKDLWSKHGIERSALNIIDGSGLSPANRVTTHALVTVMQYARQQHWFPSFYTALPEINGIKMKDGYIGGVRSFTGYVKSKAGVEYTFSFIVNNFDGSAGTVREKMWKLLDILK